MPSEEDPLATEKAKAEDWYDALTGGADEPAADDEEDYDDDFETSPNATLRRTGLSSLASTAAKPAAAEPQAAPPAASLGPVQDNAAGSQPAPKPAPKSPAKRALVVEGETDIGDEGEPMAGTQGSMPTSPAQGSDVSSSRMMSPKSKSTSALGSHMDLKKKLASADFASVEAGVKKDPTYMIHFSNFKTGPKFSFGGRSASDFMKSSGAPAPGSYNLPQEDKAKYKSEPRFSFGGCARFGLGQSPTKKMPGPGAYNPRDPTLHMEAKVGFGSGGRSKIGAPHQNPGPGAYEARSTVGQGKMFTAGGRHPTNIGRSRSQPGPGAYSPSIGQVYNAVPKCGFGTSTRTDHAARNRNACMPGPGTYEMQNFATLGTDAPKYSTTSRRRVHDLNSYVTPGPGSYNAHVTSFGY
uniref:Uncharacterized protein n=1 Tax=Alexandrium monilatum TaxID=311494 RepID=A0A7S4PSW3_9DINO